MAGIEELGSGVSADYDDLILHYGQMNHTQTTHLLLRKVRFNDNVPMRNIVRMFPNLTDLKIEAEVRRYEFLTPLNELKTLEHLEVVLPDEKEGYHYVKAKLFMEFLSGIKTINGMHRYKLIGKETPL